MYNNEFWKVQSKRWFAVLYPVNMIPDWQVKISDVLQTPGAYIIHDPDDDEPYEHVHLLLCTDKTTRKHCRDIINLLTRDLSEQEKNDNVPRNSVLACSTVQPVNGALNCWEYMCHETEASIKQHKKPYPHESRICFNGFNIYDIVSIEESTIQEVRIELSMWILETHCCLYSQLYNYALSCNTELCEYEKCVIRYSAHFDRMCRSELTKKRSGDNKVISESASTKTD